jgi:hypothetical protein
VPKNDSCIPIALSSLPSKLSFPSQSRLASLESCFASAKVSGIMKVDRSQIKVSSLHDQIEIIRDTPTTEDDLTPPILQDSDNPLHALAELVEKLESLEELTLANPNSRPTPSEKNNSRQSYMSQVDHYLTLFQKQSAVLRKIATKLN